MQQLPVRAKRSDPQNLGTADCSLICHCDDGSDYAVKDANSGQNVEHSEWFCKHLGDRVGIASPECRLVEVNGYTAFGSRWESGHDPSSWWSKINLGEIEKDRVAPTISRILAFDLFVNNEDRHGGNYIVRPQVNDSWSFLAFDYSRAWMATGWPLADAPMDVNKMTTKNFRAINKIVGGMLDHSEFMFIINKLRDVPVAYINQILEYQHDTWLSEAHCDDIRLFWESSDFLKRLDKIEEGLKNGEYV